jgi:hypothetical protein
MVQSQPGQIVCKTQSQKISSEKRADGVVQGIGHSTVKKQKKLHSIIAYVTH